MVTTAHEIVARGVIACAWQLLFLDGYKDPDPPEKSLPLLELARSDEERELFATLMSIADEVLGADDFTAYDTENKSVLVLRGVELAISRILSAFGYQPDLEDGGLSMWQVSVIEKLTAFSEEIRGTIRG